MLRALAELAAAGQVDATIAVHSPAHRAAPFVREADEAVELGDSLADALLRARAATAWLGPASLDERAAFAAACEQAGVTPVGPGAAALRRLLPPRAVIELAAELGVAPEDANARDPSASLVEVVVARDQDGATRVLGAGDASLTLVDVAVVAESPPPLAPAEEAEAFDIAERALTALGWRGIGAVRFAIAPGRRRLVLSGVDAFARSAPAVEEAVSYTHLTLPTICSV